MLIDQPIEAIATSDAEDLANNRDTMDFVAEIQPFDTTGLKRARITGSAGSSVVYGAPSQSKLFYLIVYAMIVFGLMSIPAFFLTKLCPNCSADCQDPYIGLHYANWYIDKMMNFSDEIHKNNACIVGKNPIVAKNLPNLTGHYTDLTYNKQCEQFYNLGDNDLVYACITFNKEINVYFTTFTITQGTVHYILSWRQFCAMLFLSDNLLEDITILNKFIEE